MKKCIYILIIGTIVLNTMATCAGAVQKAANTRFAPVVIYADSQKALAAYQFELKVISGDAKIVGVEGGESQAFNEAPYYDPAALMNNRIILAALTTRKDLPTGTQRIATVHMQITGDVEPCYEIKKMVAVGTNGKEISARIFISKGE